MSSFRRAHGARRPSGGGGGCCRCLSGYVPLLAAKLIDKLVLKTKKDAKHRPYTYLSRSLDNYPRPHELEKLFKAAGFRETGWTPLMMGTVAIHWGVK